MHLRTDQEFENPVGASAPCAGVAVCAFQQQILEWYGAHRRDLPWRGDSDPYHVLVSEIMLQQTQVSRVVPKYGDFLSTFPSVQALAEASVADVLRAWRGMGYNRRALSLKKAAQAICADYSGQVPRAVEDLEKLPGIGRYTSRAIACFAFGSHVAVVDTNVRRVLSAYAGRELSLRETEVLAVKLLPQGGAAEWNQALMDYGSAAFKVRPRRAVRQQGSFSSTNRFWRGRIVDALRSHERLSVDALLQAMPYPNRDEERVRSLVNVLHEEGIVDYDDRGDDVSLPGHR